MTPNTNLTQRQRNIANNITDIKDRHRFIKFLQIWPTMRKRNLSEPELQSIAKQFADDTEYIYLDENYDILYLVDGKNGIKEIKEVSKIIGLSPKREQRLLGTYSRMAKIPFSNKMNNNPKTAGKPKAQVSEAFASYRKSNCISPEMDSKLRRLAGRDGFQVINGCKRMSITKNKPKTKKNLSVSPTMPIYKKGGINVKIEELGGGKMESPKKLMTKFDKPQFGKRRAIGYGKEHFKSSKTGSVYMKIPKMNVKLHKKR